MDISLLKNPMDNPLKSIVEKFFFEEKILICPTHGIGNQILADLTATGDGWINIKARTVQSVASELAEVRVYEKNLRQISTLEVIFLVDNIFTALAGRGKNIFKSML